MYIHKSRISIYTLLVCLDLGFISSGSDEMPPNPQALQGTHGKHHKGVQVACCLLHVHRYLTHFRWFGPSWRSVIVRYSLVKFGTKHCQIL